MDTTLTFIVLLRCWLVCSRPSVPSVPFSMAFSDETQLLVDEDQNQTTGPGPSVQILGSVPVPLDPGPPRLLVCVLSGLASPLQDVLWWVDDRAVTSQDVSWVRSEGGGAYSATSVWEVSAADRRSGSTFWCGTIQQGRVYRQELCSQDRP